MAAIYSPGLSFARPPSLPRVVKRVKGYFPLNNDLGVASTNVSSLWLFKREFLIQIQAQTSNAHANI